MCPLSAPAWQLTAPCKAALQHHGGHALWVAAAVQAGSAVGPKRRPWPTRDGILVQLWAQGCNVAFLIEEKGEGRLRAPSDYPVDSDGPLLDLAELADAGATLAVSTQPAAASEQALKPASSAVKSCSLPHNTPAAQHPCCTTPLLLHNTLPHFNTLHNTPAAQHPCCTTPLLHDTPAARHPCCTRPEQARPPEID
ncbi:hypothetical protein CYMTET_42531 [Cymbomonas tetramitiformis]|uniref:Uncharacterized protein n=1 Tax=Cymbomonas tetramitiformis TaxID=36881 RepID=A0AAE0C5X9_9CHLO|nr:hypothetical protein CYMTET_42531 [Cymbomonas tetramitiformis]